MIFRYSLLFLTFGSIILQKTCGSNIRGIPGVDYPNFSEIPPTSFRCPDQEQKGFYPDFETGCQVFHYCEDGNKESFICPIGSTFNPLIKSCDRWYNSECISPVEYDVDGGYENRRDYVAGGVTSEYQLSSSSSLFDKMASLYEDRPSESKKSQEEVGYSEYDNSPISYQYDTMGENNESRPEISDISRGSTNSDSIPNERLDNYDEKESDASEDSGYLEQAQQYGEDVSVDVETEHSSAPLYVDETGSYSDHGDRPGLDVMYYRNPTIYNYQNQPNDKDNWEGESMFYDEGSDFDQEDLSYAHEKDTEGDEGFDKSKSLQKRISEYRKRPRPKPVVSLVESDLEIVTLPPLRSKRPRISLVPNDAEDKTTEPSTDVNIEPGNTEQPDAASSSSDVIGGDVNQFSSDFQQERSEDERDFGDWFPDESSGDAEDFLQESDNPDSFDDLPEFENLDPENDYSQKEVEESYTSDSSVKGLFEAMGTNVFYVDSASDNLNEKVSNLDQADESGDKFYENDVMDDYKNEASDMDERVQTEEYNPVDDFSNEIDDEVLKSHQYGVNLENDNNGYEEENEYSEDQGEMFQTLVDGKLKSFIRIGEDIIDPTEYFPEWNEASSAEMEEISKRLDYSNEKYLLGNSDGASHQPGGYHDEESLNLGQITKTSPEALEGYYADYPSDSSYQGEKDSDHAGTVTEEVTFISNSEDTFLTTQAYGELDSDGLYVYDGSEDPESIYSTDDVGFNDDQSYTHPAYFEHTILEEQDSTNADQPSDMPSNDKIYYYPTDMGSQFVTDKPDMEVATMPILNDDEFSENAGTHGGLEYVYQTSPHDASEVEFQEEYFSTDSDISDIGAQFVTDLPDFGTSTTMLDEEYSKDVNIQRGFEYPHGEAGLSDGSQSGEEFQEQYFQAYSDGSDLGTLFVTEQPEMSTTAMVNEENYSDFHDESGFAYEASQSKDSDSDLEFQEYLKSSSDFHENNPGFASAKETPKDEVKSDPELTLGSDESKQKSDVLNGSDTEQTPGLSMNLDSHFGESISSDKQPKFSETTEKSQSKETTLDSLDIKNLPKFGFDNADRFAGQIGHEMNHASFRETSHSSMDKTNDRNLKSKSACSTCSPFFSEKEPKIFSNNEFGVLDGQESRHSSRTGKLLPGSKFAKLASFLKNMIAAKKKAKINMVKKILPSTEWDFERKISE